MDINELKSRAPLIEYVSRHYPNLIEYSGNSRAKMKCLWHTESKASMVLYPDNKFKCFGCGCSGDIIDIVQELEGLTWKEAVKMIGDNVGYEVVYEPANQERESYLNQMTGYAARYYNNLEGNADALSYLYNVRKINQDTINRFRIGVTPQDEYKNRSDMGNISNRISFPIFEHKVSGCRCVGMGYGSFDGSEPKYINDRNKEDIFTKGRMLFGYPQAVDSFKLSNCAIIVEGYFDVLSMHQTGYRNTVGLMGTAMSSRHVEEIKKYTSNVLLMFDNDEAGKNAIINNLPLLYSMDMNVYICIPEVHDPDEWCKKYDFEYSKFSKSLTSRIRSGMEYVANYFTENYQNIASIERCKALKNADVVLKSIHNDTTRKLTESIIYKKLDLNVV